MSDHYTIEFGPATLAVLTRLATALERAAASQSPSSGSSRPPPQRSSDVGAVFPPYGKAKGNPVAGAPVNDLRFYAHGCVRSLRDPAKARFHSTEKQRLDAINAELVRQGQEPVEFEPDPSEDDFDETPPGGPGPLRPQPDEDIPF